MIRKGYYTIDDIKSFFKYREDDEEDIDDGVVEGDVFELKIREFPPLSITVQVEEIVGDLLYCEILEVDGNTDEHKEGDLILIPKEGIEC